MPKKILLLVLSCTLSLFNLHAQNNRHDTETDPKDKGLAEYYEGQMNRPKSRIIKARVIEIVYDDTEENRPNIPIESDFRYQHLKIKILTGRHKGEIYTVRNTVELAVP